MIGPPYPLRNQTRRPRRRARRTMVRTTLIAGYLFVVAFGFLWLYGNVMSR